MDLKLNNRHSGFRDNRGRRSPPGEAQGLAPTFKSINPSRKTLNGIFAFREASQPASVEEADLDDAFDLYESGELDLVDLLVLASEDDESDEDD